MSSIFQLFSRLFSATQITLSTQQIAWLNERTARLALYHFNGCIYCAKVKRLIKKYQLKIELRDIYAESEHKTTLVKFGGKQTVPCLRIAHADNINDDKKAKWLYESADIVQYLQQLVVESESATKEAKC